MAALTDKQKHAEAQRRGMPHAVFLPRLIYRAAEEAGVDMTCFVIQKLIPRPRPRRKPHA